MAQVAEKIKLKKFEKTHGGKTHTLLLQFAQKQPGENKILLLWLLALYFIEHYIIPVRDKCYIAM